MFLGPEFEKVEQPFCLQLSDLGWNLAELRARNVRFLVAARQPERDQCL